MSDHPLVSIVIPVYNAGNYLKAAVLSIVNQTYTHLEIIIINDGSTDDCINTLTEITDNRIRILHQENQGIAATLNRGLNELTGNFFMIQDADDISYPQRIEKQLQCLQTQEELAAVYIGHDLILNGQQFSPSFNTTSIEECHELVEAFKIPAHDATGMYRLSLIQGIRFDESLRIEQGVDFVLQVGEKHPILGLGECLYSYRINYHSITRQDPSLNNQGINAARKKVCKRRNLDFSQYQITLKPYSPLFPHRQADTHIIPHCMRSVLDLKQVSRWKEAINVGWQCLKLHPLDPYYYKPFFYILAPIRLITFYRQFKQSITS